MKAAVLKKFGSPLIVEDVPNPKLGTGEVIADVAAAPVLSYADEVFSGKRKYLSANTRPARPKNAGAKARKFCCLLRLDPNAKPLKICPTFYDGAASQLLIARGLARFTLPQPPAGRAQTKPAAWARTFRCSRSPVSAGALRFRLPSRGDHRSARFVI
jgi:hypothetical protein